MTLILAQLGADLVNISKVISCKQSGPVFWPTRWLCARWQNWQNLTTKSVCARDLRLLLRLLPSRGRVEG